MQYWTVVKEHSHPIELQNRADLRIQNNFRQYWTVVKEYSPPVEILEVIRDAWLYGVYQIRTFIHDSGLLTAFVDRWRLETHIFRLRVGEATITLEDVNHIY